MRVVELFAGVGGFRIGLEGPPASKNGSDFKVVWSNQWEPSTKVQHAAEVYASNWNLEPTEEPSIFAGESGEVFVNRDIASIDADSIPDHELLCGGFPCQDYSVAKTLSTAHGIAGKKGVLWWEIRRILEAKRPRFVLLENVDRLLKSPRSQRGRDFAIMLASLSDLGYSSEWRVVDASEYGFPQRRKRVFILAEHNARWDKPIERINTGGYLSEALPIKPLLGASPVHLGTGNLSDITEEFNSEMGDTPTPFGNCGVITGREVWTARCEANYEGAKSTLGDILQPPIDIPDLFVLEPESLLREKGWIYLKGSKKEKREGSDGFTYNYSEGPVTFPDSLERASRTIITGEGGNSPSRFKHVVRFCPTREQSSRLGIEGRDADEVRRALGLTDSEWLRRLTPVELERLNGFPDGHTAPASDGKRAFFMGNALVCGIVERIGKQLIGR